MKIGNGSSDLIVHTETLAKAGQDIQASADNLGKDVKLHMGEFTTAATASVVPACLRTLLTTYSDSRTKEMDSMIANRHKIGELLARASDLHAFNEEMQRSGFARLYQGASNYYGSTPGLDNPNLTNLQAP